MYEPGNKCNHKVGGIIVDVKVTQVYAKVAPSGGDFGNHSLWNIARLLEEGEAKYCMGFEVTMVPQNQS